MFLPLNLLAENICYNYRFLTLDSFKKSHYFYWKGQEEQFLTFVSDGDADSGVDETTQAKENGEEKRSR